MNRLKELRVANKKFQKDIAAYLHIDRTVYLRMENGKYRLEDETVKKLAEYYGVTTDYILGVENQSKVKGIKIPVLGRIIAGVPLEAIENIEGYEEITPEMAAKGEYFALKVRGNSMEPALVENDLVIVREQEDVESGDVAVVLVDNEKATVKKVRKQDNGITLVAYNPMVYEPHFYSNEDIEKFPVKIIGKVVESRRSFE